MFLAYQGLSQWRQERPFAPGLLTMKGLILSSLTSLLLWPYPQSQRDTNKVEIDYLYHTVQQEGLSVTQRRNEEMKFLNGEGKCPKAGEGSVHLSNRKASVFMEQ